MIRSVRFKRAIVGLLLSALLATLACDDGSVDVARPAPTPDIVDADGPVKAYLYLAGNAHHAEILEPVMARRDVGAAISAFAAGGYELSLENSFTVSGTDGENDVSATFIGMIGTGGSRGRSVSIVCYESEGESGVSAVLFSAYPLKGQSDWRRIGDGAWYRPANEGDFDSPCLSEQRIDWTTWSDFWDCIVSRMPGAAVGCAVGCVMVPGYGQCLFMCVVGQSLSTVVGCLITAILSGGKKAKY